MNNWLEVALKEYGTKEIPGSRHNPKILEYHKETELSANSDEVAWCSAFVNWCFKQVEIDGTHSALARSWLAWGEALEKPQLGCVVVFKRGSEPWQGHVGFFICEGFDHIYTLGGNQSNEVKISAYKKTDLLGYRWPSLSPGLTV